jgi:hypothetical protein
LHHPALRVSLQQAKKQLIKLKAATCKFNSLLRILWEVGDGPKEVPQLQLKINIYRQPKRNLLLNQTTNNSC